MFEELNYTELQEWKGELLTELQGFSYDDPKTEVVKDWIKAVTDEVQRRDSRAHRRLLSVVTVNLLALVFILGGCQTFDGVKGDLHWLTADNDHSAQTERK